MSAESVASSTLWMESTPLVLEPSRANDRTSEAFPRTTPIESSSIRRLEESVRSFVAPEPTGSRMIGTLSSLARLPAFSIESIQ